jgi:hypothetical protein
MPILGSRNEFEAGRTSLQTHDADPRVVEQIRARCLAPLEARRRRAQERSPFPAAWRHWLEPAAAFALSALYLAAAVSSSLALLR